MVRALVFLLVLSPSFLFAQTDGNVSDWVIFDDSSGNKFFNSGFGDQGWDVVSYAGQYGAGTSLAYGPAGTDPVINWPAAQVPVGVYDVVVYLSPDAAPAQSVQDGTVVSSFLLTLNGTAYTVQYPVDVTASHLYNGKAFGVVSSVTLIGDPGQATVTVNLSAGVTLYDSSGGFIHSQWPIDAIALFKTADAAGDDPSADPGDCDGDGTPDADQIAADPTLDKDLDGLLDSCDDFVVLHDCNCNGAEDADEVSPETDADSDGILDACQGENLGPITGVDGGTDESGLDDAGKPKDTFGGNYETHQYDQNGDGIKDGCGALDDVVSSSGGCCCCSDGSCDICQELAAIKELLQKLVPEDDPYDPDADVLPDHPPHPPVPEVPGVSVPDPLIPQFWSIPVVNNQANSSLAWTLDFPGGPRTFSLMSWTEYSPTVLSSVVGWASLADLRAFTRVCSAFVFFWRFVLGIVHISKEW